MRKPKTGASDFAPTGKLIQFVLAIGPFAAFLLANLLCAQKEFFRNDSN